MFVKNSQCTGYEAPVRLALLLGLRKSEALGLRWSDIDFGKKTVTIQNAVVRIGAKEEDTEMTKNKTSRRTLILPDSLFVYLKELKKKNEENHVKTDYICCWPDGRRIGSDWLSSSFKTFLRKNGLPEVRFHDLRHTAASLLLSNGLELKDVSSYLGHSTIVTTADIYGHLDSKRTGKIANGINDIFSNISQGKDVFLLIFLPFVSFFVSLFDII